MNRYVVKESVVEGSVAAPPSKSQTLRAILFGSMGCGQSIVRGYLNSPDTDKMIEACRLLGANIDVTATQLTIEGVDGSISFAEDVIDAGNSGIVLRFCTAISALSTQPVVVTGDASIRHQRPMAPLLDGLRQWGVKMALSTRGDGYAPVIVQGPLNGDKAAIDGADSQAVSAMLIAAAFSDRPLTLHINNAGEKPWIEMTLHWLEKLGASVWREGYDKYVMKGSCSYRGFDYMVPGDFSSAAFPLAAALVTGSSLTVQNLDINDVQGDKELIFALKRMGADITIDSEAKSVHVRSGSQGLRGIDVDVNDFIDAVPILAVVGCYAEGQTRIYNGAIARHKECDRLRCIATELQKMGANITEMHDGLLVCRSELRGATLFSHHDHRIAMSLAVAALAADGDSIIEAVDCVAKTFPSFLRNFQALGANITAIPAETSPLRLLRTLREKGDNG